MNLLAVVTFVGFEKVVTFLVMLSVLIVLHEVGHFVLARRNGVRVNEFAIGFGPNSSPGRALAVGRIYRCACCRSVVFARWKARIIGSPRRSSSAISSRAPRVAESNFQAKSPWRRLAIVVAGPLANFVLCYSILLVGALGVRRRQRQSECRLSEKILPASPAAIAGIRPGDRIAEIDDVTVTSGKLLVDTIHHALGKKLDLVYERNGIRSEIYVTPRPCPAQVGKKFGCIGFSPVSAYERVGFVTAVRQSADEFVAIANQTFGGIALLATQFGKYAPEIAGPIGMGQVAATVQDWGWGPYFSLAATISFALGLFNLLPIPALDGGRAAFIVAELIRGRPVDPEKEAMVHIAGFAALMALIMLVAFHDIVRIVSGQGVM